MRRLLVVLACVVPSWAWVRDDGQSGEWKTMTFYDVLQEDCRHDVANKDVGDPAGA